MSLPHTSERNDNIAFIAGAPPVMTSLSCSDGTLLFAVSVYALTSDLDGEDWLN